MSEQTDKPMTPGRVTIHCVIHDSHRVLSKDVELAAVPFIGAAIEYHEDWGLGTVEWVYIGRDYIEAGMRMRFKDDERDELIAAGWECR